MNIKDLLFTTVNEGLYEHVNHCWSFVRNGCNWKEKNISDFILNILARQKLGGIISSLPPATKLGQGYIFTGDCDSVHRGFCLSTRWDTTPRPGRHPPGTRQAPPGPGSHPPDQAGTPSSRAYWEIRSTSGRYSYWNAILFTSLFPNIRWEAQIQTEN